MKKQIDTIFDLIVEANTQDHVDAIPHSDQFAKMLESERGIERHEISKAANILKEAHKIFFIEVVKEDKDKDVKRVVGYVDANLTTIRRLKDFFRNKLVEQYEHQFRRRLPAVNILKDILTRPAQYRNSPLGQLGNKAMMLEEYENLLLKEFNEYTDSWKRDKLNEIIRQIEEMESKQTEASTAAPAAVTARSAPNRRAVDTDTYREFSKTSQQQPVTKLLKIYGVEFFCRVSLRKYDFSLLRILVEKGEINRKDDLKMLKDMMQAVKNNFHRDPQLAGYEEQINRLEKAVLVKFVSAKR